MPMSCHAEVSSYQSWVIANRKTLLFRFGTYALSLVHKCEVLAVFPILAFLLRSRWCCTQHPFLFNCKHRFSLVQLHYSNRKSPCQHPENRIASRFLPKWRPLFPRSIFCSFKCFLVVNILQKNFSKNFLITINLAFSGVNLPHVAIKKKRRVFASPEPTPALNRVNLILFAETLLPSMCVICWN